MKDRITLSDIAKAVGCAKSTVSMALRGNQSIPAVTRNKIHEACQRLEYHPNPLLASLASNRFHSAKSVSDIPLAFITVDSTQYKEAMALSVATDRATKLGYQVKCFPVSELASMHEPGKMLYNRGIQGVILPTFFDPSSLPRMDWKLFSVVALGHPLEIDSIWASTGFHRVTADHYETVAGAWKRAVRYGYRKIGAAFSQHSPRLRDDELRHAAFLYCLSETPKSRRIPIFDAGGRFGEPCDLRQWLEKHHPDVVIGMTAQVWWDIRKADWKVPEDVAFINLHKDQPERYPENETMAGMIDQTMEEVVAAIEILDQNVRLRYRGMTKTPQTIMLHPHWVDAVSLPSSA